MFQHAHELGMFTVLWCYLRNSAFKTKEADYHLAADLTGQANHLGVTIEADIIKQKLPETNGGYNVLNFGKTHKKVYSDLTSDNPIDLTRYRSRIATWAALVSSTPAAPRLARAMSRRPCAPPSSTSARGNGTHLRTQGVPAPMKEGSVC
jgi:hypothetical protein